MHDDSPNAESELRTRAFLSAVTGSLEISVVALMRAILATSPFHSEGIARCGCGYGSTACTSARRACCG